MTTPLGSSSSFFLTVSDQRSRSAMTLPPARNDEQLCGDVEETFQIARGLHNDGKLCEAERLYQSILAERPSHLGSLFFLGFLRAQANKMDEAVCLFGRAVAAEPTSASALGLFGLALAALDRHDEALASYQKAGAISK
jgi:tetratricopeptide (TPR) repeat protein